jgi:1-deoxy-D-xylulose-5-phosphate reductoisomerase
MKKKICILGSTGNIGQLTLRIVEENKKDFRVLLISANKNHRLLLSQAKKFNPKYIFSTNDYLIEKINNFCKKKRITIIKDIKLINKKDRFDISVCAISGMAGLVPTIDIVKHSKEIAIANKESIICGWKFIKRELLKYNCKFIPLDSEHFSIYNLIQNKDKKTISEICLTASGGPFFGKKINLKNITPSQAIKHPKWKMGKKISVDSANLMNKVLEVFEASLLFNLPLSKFSIMIHPQSLIHSVVKYNNGLSTMMYHYNDMKIPIMNCLYKNFDFNDYLINKFSFSKNRNLELFFYKVDPKKNHAIKVLNLAKKLNVNGYITINALNELLVEKFLEKKISFSDIIYKLHHILQSKIVKNYLKNNKIKHINDVFKNYEFCRSILN